MILTSNEIKKQISLGRIKIHPFSNEISSSNSYDLSLGNKLIKYSCDIIDPRKNPEYEEIVIPESGFTMNSGDFYLGHSEEMIGSNHYVPIIHARSGIARLGLFIHVTADLIDIGSYGQVTFQLFSTLPIRIYPKMKIAQVSFWETYGEITLYSGKYQGSTGPVTSKIWIDG